MGHENKGLCGCVFSQETCSWLTSYFTCMQDLLIGLSVSQEGDFSLISLPATVCVLQLLTQSDFYSTLAKLREEGNSAQAQSQLSP